MARHAVTLVKQKSISKRNGKTHAYEYYVLRWHDEQTGKKRGRNIGRVGVMPQREARKQRDLFAVELQQNPDRRNPDRAPALERYGEQFLRLKKADGISARTASAYGYALRLLKAYFGKSRPIDKITRLTARKFKIALACNELNHVNRSTCKRKTLNGTSVETHMRHVHAIFEFAIEPLDILETNPFRKLRGKQAPSREWRYVALEEFWRLFDAASDAWKTMLVICRLAGLRRSDAMSLTWANVDFSEGVLKFTTQKTGKFARIPMCAELVQVLRSDERGATLRMDDRVVPQRLSRSRAARPEDYVSTANVGRHFEKLRELAGVAEYGSPLHTLRKSCINDWAKLYPPNAVQEWATHSSIQTTMTYYAKVSRDQELAAQKPVGGRIDKDLDKKRLVV